MATTKRHINWASMRAEEAIEKYRELEPEGKRLWVFQRGNVGDESGGFEYANMDDWSIEHTLHVRDEEDELSTDEFGVFYDSSDESLTITEVHGGLQYGYTVFQWRDDPWFNKPIVCCWGAHYGFEWGPSAEDLGVDSELDDRDETDLLRKCIEWCNTEESQAQIGVEWLDDPTDDGVNVAIVDRELFKKLLSTIRQIEDEIDFAEELDLEALAEKVVSAAIRDLN